MNSYDFVLNKDKLFNPLYYKIKNCNTRFIVNYGGAGSGKSVAQHQHELLLQLSTDCNYDTLFIRKESNDLEDSCYKLLTNLAKKYDCYDEFNWTFSNAKRQIKNKSTGHVMLFKGINDSEKLKSIVGIKRIIVEEANQLEFEDFLELNRRARGMEDIQIVFLLNPINVNHWIKTKIIEGIAYSKKLTVIHTTYKDNKFLTEDDREELENLKLVDENHYRIYCLGQWGIDDPEKLFAKDYKQDKHFGKTFNELYSRDHEIYLAWDFNIQNTCLAIQNIDGAINVLREYHIKGYDLQMLSELIKKDFPGHLYIVNGDASGRSGSALTTGNVSAYHMLRGYLNIGNYSFHVPNANPSHLNSRLLTNLIFKFSEVNICKDCVQLDNDLMSCEIDDRGSLDTYKKKHPDRSHWQDPLRYHFHFEHYSKIKMIGIKEYAEE
jgi:phage terminase large subunit